MVAGLYVKSVMFTAPEPAATEVCAAGPARTKVESKRARAATAKKQKRFGVMIDDRLSHFDDQYADIQRPSWAMPYPHCTRRRTRRSGVACAARRSGLL